MPVPYAFFHVLADAAEKQTLRHFRKNITIDNKEPDDFDPVTDGDRKAEIAIRELIAQSYPTHGIHGEEFDDVVGTSSLTWVLDPIDGTRAFISGLPVWGTLIGLLQNDKAILGMMTQPYTGERYFGNGTQSWLQDKNGTRQLKTRDCFDLHDAVLATTSPKLFAGQEHNAYERVESCVKLARYGLDCYAYAMVALGYMDCVVESGLKAVDIAALIPIIEGAGGVVTTWDGEPAHNGGQIVASANAKLHQSILDTLSNRAGSRLLRT